MFDVEYAIGDPYLRTTLYWRCNQFKVKERNGNKITLAASICALLKSSVIAMPESDLVPK
jgi:hypothetical protein